MKHRNCNDTVVLVVLGGGISGMAPDGPTAEMDAWVQDLFGIDPRSYAGSPAIAGKQPGTSPGGNAIGVGTRPGSAPPTRPAPDPAVWTRSVGVALTKDGPGKPGARIKPDLPTGPATVCKAADGKQISIAKSADGRVAMTRDPPPITEITFSGGGGKGAALPGAVWALGQTGALAQAKEIHGASVGSLTASMLAAGMTPQDFQTVSSETDFKKVINGNDILPFGHDGKGFETLVRDKMKSAINKQIAEFAEDAKAKGTPIDAKTQATLEAMSRKFASGAGPTFGDLRVLSKIIPAIKEVVISGTMIGSAPPAAPGEKPNKMKDTKPELRIFSADTEPDLEVAQAVHASAALPPVFKNVDLKLQDGSVGRFEDGGVLNNAPSSDTTGSDRNVDPVPSKSKMTFLFESKESRDVEKGVATPDRSAISDIIAGAEFSAAEYSSYATLAERPQDVVVVPLKFTRTNGSKEDYSGLKGTLAFDMKKEDAIRLQGMTEADTKAYIEKQRQPETRGFDSEAQMLNCIPREDLATLAANDYPGAKAEVQFRASVFALVGQLESLADHDAKSTDPKVRDLLKSIDDLAQGDQERVGFIGRALNGSGKLDRLLAGARDPNGRPSTGIEALDAGLAVNEVVQARATAKKILDDALYPKLVRVGTKGVEGGLLKQMNEMLRKAKSRREINRALTIGIDYYDDKFDLGGLLGNGKFAAELRGYLQPTH